MNFNANSSQEIALRLIVCTGMMVVLIVSGCAPFATTSNPNEVPLANDGLELRFSAARLSERDGALLEAREAYLALLDSDPHYVPALHRLGVVSVKLDDVERAIGFLQQARQLQPQSVEVLGDLGYAQFLIGDVDAAADTLVEAFDRDPTHQRNMNNLALVLGRQGRINESLSLFRRVNSEASALSNIGFVLSQNGDYQSAKRYFHQALELDPTIREAAHGLMELHRYETDREPVALEQRHVGDAAQRAVSIPVSQPINDGRPDTYNRRVSHQERNSSVAPDSPVSFVVASDPVVIAEPPKRNIGDYIKRTPQAGVSSKSERAQRMDFEENPVSQVGSRPLSEAPTRSVNNPLRHPQPTNLRSSDVKHRIEPGKSSAAIIRQ